MKADDPRHGTTKGYAAGCRRQCCRQAMSRYDKKRKLTILESGAGFSVSALGAKRRLEALMALGWSADALAAELAWGHRNDVNRIRSCKWLERKTNESINVLFDRLCMTPGPSAITKTRAARQGWLPPLAWDDIDNDPHPPNPQPVEMDILNLDDPKKKVCQFSKVDHVAVDRALEGDLTALSTTAEKAEVALRWRSAGRSLSELERLTGWNVHRLLRSVPQGDAA